jgi:hypothetical protein
MVDNYFVSISMGNVPMCVITGKKTIKITVTQHGKKIELWRQNKSNKKILHNLTKLNRRLRGLSEYFQNVLGESNLTESR